MARKKVIKQKKLKQQKKVKKVMAEFKARTLHSGSKKGPLVTNPEQAIAISMSESGQSKVKTKKKKKRGK